MPVISIRFDSCYLVSASQGGKQRGREKNRVTAREGSVSRLAWFGCYREGRVYYKKIFISRYAAGFCGSSSKCCSIIALWLSYKLGR